MELTLKQKADKIDAIRIKIQELDKILYHLKPSPYVKKVGIGYIKGFKFFRFNRWSYKINESFELDYPVIEDFKSCIQRRKEDLEHELDLLIV